MLGLIGISHKSASVEIRERFAFDENSIAVFGAMLKTSGVEGVVVLSTCNRTEIYFEFETCCSSKGFDLVTNLLRSYKEYEGELHPHFYLYEGLAVAQHLFRVASGLDSMALG